MKNKYIIGLIILTLLLTFNAICFAKGSVGHSSSHSSGARSSSSSHVTTSKPSSTPKSSSSSTSTHSTNSNTSHFSNPFLWFMVGGAVGYVTNDNNDVNIYGEQQVQNMQLDKKKVIFAVLVLIGIVILVFGLIYIFKWYL